MELNLHVSEKQNAFIQATENEVLYGGAAGGGKSYAQLVDALLYAIHYPGSRQLILRSSFPELERSLIDVHLGFYPRAIYKYNQTAHRGVFANGSVIEFGYLANHADVYQYQGAEYDTIRFDELTLFEEGDYLYLLSRLRGANEYPKQIKSSTNPGGIGHTWVKKRFIDPAPPGQSFQCENGSRIFLPARLQDNKYLMEKDPGYLQRLKNLSANEQKAYLYGDWDIFEGQFFTEFDRAVHLYVPFEPPAHWRRYLTVDYGLDMLAAYWIAVDEQSHGWVYRELYQSDLIISKAAQAILEAEQGEQIYLRLAPPDLWNRRQETGQSVIDLFAGQGLIFTKTSNDRKAGWLAVKEWLALRPDETGGQTPRLKIAQSCRNLIRTLPALQQDPLRPGDVTDRPHELTHGPDALRGFCIYWTQAARPPAKPTRPWTADMYEDYKNAAPDERAVLTQKWGRPNHGN